jgi:hypothetical protein
MRANRHLSEAIGIFTELGWAEAAIEQAPDLPTGTAEQRRLALSGLNTGDWDQAGVVGSETYGWANPTYTKTAMLALFAVKVGVDARRAAAILSGPGIVPDEVSFQVLAGRSPAFAAAFVQAACRSNRRPWEHAPSVHGGAAVRLVAHHNIAVPQNTEYLKDWAAFALAVITGDRSEIYPRERSVPTVEVIRSRFAEHAEAAGALAMNATGPFGRVVPAAVAQGWWGRDQAVELSFLALDSAQRPGDRKRWAEILTDHLEISDAELLARADALVPTLATGEAPLVERFAPRLIGGLPAEELGEVALVSLMANSRKAQKVVLKALAGRPAPTAEAAEMLAPRLAELASDSDPTLARAATELAQTWGVDCEPVGSPEPIRGLWQPTPPLWQVPDFDPGPLTAQALTEAAANLVGGPDTVDDISVDRFLTILVAVAHQDEAAARLALRGAKTRSDPGLRPVQAWLAQVSPRWGLDPEGHFYNTLTAREFAIFQRLGELPCLLSQPSRVDLRIRIDDLVARLVAYRDAGVDVVEADLLAALFRLDPADPGVLPAASELAIKVRLQSGAVMARTAGQILHDYLADPLVDPGLQFESGRWKFWASAKLTVPASLAGFPPRLASCWPDPFTFPGWGDSTMTGLHWSSEADRGLGLLARQVARRATPLPPGGALNLLAIQRSAHPAAAGDAATAVSEAWQRGLLQPGVADVTYLDWSDRRSNLAALAAALVMVADGGTLSVVWPILDDLLIASLRAVRMLAGTAEVVAAMASLLPEVDAAVAAGLAPAEALELPGVRELAARAGASRAVVLAGELAARLPAATVAVTGVAPEPQLVNEAFEALWPEAAGTLPAVTDEATLAVSWLDPDASSRQLRFDVTLPQYPEQRFQVTKRWVYDLEQEGQCEAESVPLDNPEARTPAWLHWDATDAALVAAANRNWREGKDGPLAGGSTPLSTTLVAISLGLTSQDGDASLDGMHLVRDLVSEGEIGWAAVRQAMGQLLAHSVFSPVRLARLLEDDPSLLPVLWPVLTEAIQVAGASDTALPRWLNRILDTAVLRAPHLAEAARRGRIPAQAAAWSGLAEIAARGGSSSAVAKARQLIGLLGLPD